MTGLPFLGHRANNLRALGRPFQVMGVRFGGALNWYPRRNLRAQFNLIYYDAERDTGDESGWIAQTRIQLSW